MLPACFARCPFPHPCSPDCPIVRAQFGPEPRRNAVRVNAAGVKLCCVKGCPNPRERGPRCIQHHAEQCRKWYHGDIQRSRQMGRERYKTFRRAHGLAMREGK